jgi:transposase
LGRGEVVVVPRTSRYRIELTAEERRELERRAQTPTLPFRDAQRARLILYAAEGLPDQQIAVRVDCHPEVVSRWRRRFCEEGIEGLQDRPRAGRPRRFPPEQVAEVVAVACELPARHGRPLGRFSRSELHQLVLERASCEAPATRSGVGCTMRH